MNVISAKKAWLHFQPRNNKRGRRCTVFHNSERRLAMETNAVEKPTIRFLKNFIVEENLAAVSWPHECAACGGVAEVEDDIPLKENFKGFGEVRVEVAGIPYCLECFPRIRAGKRLNKLVWTFSIIFGIPIGILLIMAAMTNQNTSFVMCGLLIALGWAAGYGLAWLFIKLPARVLLKKRIIEPVDAWLIKEEKKDKREGISVVLSIPNKQYAQKFALANGVQMP